LGMLLSHSGVPGVATFFGTAAIAGDRAPSGETDRRRGMLPRDPPPAFATAALRGFTPRVTTQRGRRAPFGVRVVEPGRSRLALTGGCGWTGSAAVFGLPADRPRGTGPSGRVQNASVLPEPDKPRTLPHHRSRAGVTPGEAGTAGCNGWLQTIRRPVRGRHPNMTIQSPWEHRAQCSGNAVLRQRTLPAEESPELDVPRSVAAETQHEARGRPRRGHADR
jgi:hypothetical protein